jgi:hypothetical protein
MTVDVSHTSSWPVQVAARQRRLRLVNIAVGLTLALEGVLMLMLSNTLALPITASYLTNDPVAVRGPTMPWCAAVVCAQSGASSQLRPLDRVLGQRLDHDRVDRPVRWHP